MRVFLLILLCAACAWLARSDAMHTAEVDQLLFSAASSGNVSDVQAAINHRANLNAVDKYGFTPLHRAAEKGLKEIVKLLIDSGAVIGVITLNGDTPLHWAAHNGHTETVNLLINHDANVNAKNQDGWTPLHCAALNGHTEIVRLLLAHNADINKQNKSGDTPLHWAASKGHTETVNLLIDHDANVNAKNQDGYTPLHCATEYGHTEIVQLLIDHDANVNAKSPSGSTPLHQAASKGHTETVNLLIDRGANIEATQSDYTPLRWAVENGHTATVQLLIERGANIEATDHNGFTLLHDAAWKGHTEIVQLLINHGANVNAKSQGHTPAQVAARHGHKDIKKLLLDHVANIKKGAHIKAAQKSAVPLHVSASCDKEVQTLAKELEKPDLGRPSDLVAYLLEQHLSLAAIDYLLSTVRNVIAAEQFLNCHDTITNQISPVQVPNLEPLVPVCAPSVQPFDQQPLNIYQKVLPQQVSPLGIMGNSKPSASLLPELASDSTKKIQSCPKSSDSQSPIAYPETPVLSTEYEVYTRMPYVDNASSQKSAPSQYPEPSAPPLPELASDSKKVQPSVIDCKDLKRVLDQIQVPTEMPQLQASPSKIVGVKMLSRACKE